MLYNGNEVAIYNTGFLLIFIKSSCFPKKCTVHLKVCDSLLPFYNCKIADMCGITGREDFSGVELEKIFYVRNGRRFFSQQQM